MIKFASATKQGTHQFLPGISLAFADPDAEPYFIAAGWAEATDEPAAHTYSAEEVSIDPLTRSAETGAFVLPELAAQHDGVVELPVGEAGTLAVHNTQA